MLTSWEFQSTRPLRAATRKVGKHNRWISISIHAALAGRDGAEAGAGVLLPRISIHAALAGRDGGSEEEGTASEISIHAALAGRDLFAWGVCAATDDFNPRGPCGPRRRQTYGCRMAR